MECRHPITYEWCELTNRQWRCTLLAIPTNCSQWELHCAERNFEKLFAIVAERRFDTATMAWLKAQLIGWPRNVLRSPHTLQQWYAHISAYYNIDTIVAQLEQAKLMQAKLAKLQASRKLSAQRMIRQMQKQLELLKQARIRKTRAQKLRKRR